MTITEKQFSKDLKAALTKVSGVKSVVGPSRSGAIASAYASHILSIPFLPYGAKCPDSLRPILIIDTALMSGKTLRKAAKKYSNGPYSTTFVYNEPPRIHFWYENGR